MNRKERKARAAGKIKTYAREFRKVAMKLAEDNPELLAHDAIKSPEMEKAFEDLLKVNPQESHLIESGLRQFVDTLIKKLKQEKTDVE
jgi:hypothetical protein